MTREETRKAAEVMMAYANGEIIEVRDKGDDHWMVMTIEPSWMWDECDYRIAAEPHYRPFANAEEIDKAIKYHGACIRKKNSNVRNTIIEYDNDTIGINNSPIGLDFKTLADNYIFIDGTPFGKLIK